MNNINKNKKAVGRKAPKGSEQASKSSFRILSKGGGMDLTFLVLVLLILTIGLVMMFSASYADAYYREGNSFFYISRQFIFACIGVVAMLFVSKVDYRVYMKFAVPIMGVTILLLLIVFTQPEINDARRWIFLPGGLTFQPSEIAKLAVPILFARLMTVNKDKMGKFMHGIVIYGAILGILALLLVAQPHLSGTVVVVGIGAVMIFVGGAKIWQLIACAGVGAGAAGLLLVALGQVERMMYRVNIWLDPFADPRGAGFQTVQSLYAIGSGGLMGVGIGNSRQKFLYIPEPHNDFIFAVVCEEVGFVGATIIILIFVLLIWRGFTIALRCKDRFGTLLVTGLTAQIAIQVLLNIAVVTNTVPNTGISLPFFSYGGTSLLMLLAQMGIILSVSREAVIEKG